MQNRSLKTLIITTTLTPSLIIALALGIYLSHSRLRDLDQLLHDRGTTGAVQLANAARQGILSADERTLQNIVALALEEPGVTAVALYDRAGHLLKRVGPQSHAIESRNLTVHPLTIAFAQTLRFIAPINSLNDFTATLSEIDSEDPAPLGWVIVDYSRESNLIETYRTLFITGLIIALTFFGAVTIAVLSSRRLDRAITALQHGIRRIEHGDLDTPIHLGSNDMLQAVAHDLNNMSATLQASSTELRRNLEQTNHDLRESLDTVEVQNIELDLARREAVAASRMKSEFLANTSHELRTPLNGIIGFAKLLLKTVLDARQRDYLETLRYSAENLLSIINDILDFSKIEAGKLTLDSTPFNLRELIEDTLAILAPSATEKRLELILLYDDTVAAELIGDPLRLRQVLTNLISNATKFTARGHIAVRVEAIETISTVEAAAAYASIKISVSDTGVGIASAQQHLLFNAFSQADASTSREFGGTGLGLAISKRLIEQMGGEIGVDSQLGKGSTFWFSLRLQAQQNPLQLRRFDQLAGTHIALYDPNPLSQLALRQLLESWRIDVIALDTWPTDRTQIRCNGWLLNPALGESIPTLASSITLPVWLLQPRGVTATAISSNAMRVLSKPIHHVQLYDALCAALLRQIPPPEIPSTHYPLHVLAVDDNATNLKLIALLLEELGATTTLATNGHRALEHCTQQRFDLILLDIQMPELSGPQVAALIRNGDSANRDTPIAALTAHLLREEQKQLLANDFDQCLTKPITEEQLKQLLEACTTSSHRVAGGPVRIELCLTRARNKAVLAKEFLEGLLHSLDHAHSTIATALQRDDRDVLLHETHKLHGACCYSGVPYLQQCGHRLEEALKCNADLSEIQNRVAELLSAIQDLQQWSDDHDLDILFDADIEPSSVSTPAINFE